ncbi:MAG TPA: hypothetical protein VFG58_08490 [Solirubrobacterales bacterium]|nr:hypothetical protein [Solirubrobacterales bacterium]
MKDVRSNYHSRLRATSTQFLNCGIADGKTGKARGKVTSHAGVGLKRTNIHPRLVKVQGVKAGASSDVVNGQAGRDQTDHPRRQVIG